MFTQKFMQEIERSFEAQLNRLGERRTEVETALSKCSDDEAEALKCLYASMPVSDAADYEAELFLSYAKHGVFLWEAGPFAGTIPEEIFAGYILHHRVNNEDLTPCRPFFYEKLHKRIEGLSMEKAILEINYWCAEEATYRTTDDRTASAECVYRSAYGRCGEEPPLQYPCSEVSGFRQGRCMFRFGLTVMIIMRGWKSGAMACGSFWEHVSRRKF